MRQAVLFAILLPPLLDEIILKIIKQIGILNGMVGVNKVCYHIFSPLHKHGMSHQVIEEEF
jgi:hypothetical protein